MDRAKHFDAIVIGVGGIGSAATFYLAQRGLRVLGIEQFSIAHDLGSSHGETRAIRKAYFEHPSYVPLLNSAYELWEDLNRRSEQPLFFRPGLLEIGPPSGELAKGLQTAASEHDLPLELIGRQQFAKRFGDAFHLPEDAVAFYEPDGGLLKVEQCIEAYCREARGIGATIKENTCVQGWERAKSGAWEVESSGGIFSCDRLIVTAGPWANMLLDGLQLPLRLVRKFLHWYQVPMGAYSITDNSPLFFYESEDRYFYGFPDLGEGQIKVAEHSGGVEIQSPTEAEVTVDPDLEKLREFVGRHLKKASNHLTRHCRCIYTVTPDGHFVVDRHPEHDSMAIVAGLSGHGFKFASVLGALLADWCENNQWSAELEFLRMSRFK